MNVLDSNIPNKYIKAERYTGELIDNSCNELLYGYDFTGSKSCYLYIKNISGNVVTNKSKGIICLNLDKLEDTEYGLVYKKYTLISGINYISVSNTNYIMKFLASKYVRRLIDKKINDMLSKRKNHPHRIDKQTNIVIPTLREPYYSIVIDNKKLIESEYTDNLDIVREYYNKLLVMKSDIYLEVSNKVNKTLVNRIIKDDGIYYRVLKNHKYPYSYTEYIESIEHIYKYRDSYNNLYEKDGYIVILGVDGKYKYDMNEVNREYNKNIMKSTISKKASILGIKYIERITANGDLIEVSSSGDSIILPKSVRMIQKGAVKINENNKLIEFNSGIEHLDKQFIVSEVYTKLDYIRYVINKVDRKIRHTILKNIVYSSNRYKNIIIDIIDNIEPDDLIDLMEVYWDCDIKALNFGKGLNNDDILYKTLIRFINTKCKNIIKVTGFNTRTLKFTEKRLSEDIPISKLNTEINSIIEYKLNYSKYMSDELLLKVDNINDTLKVALNEILSKV